MGGAFVFAIVCSIIAAVVAIVGVELNHSGGGHYALAVTLLVIAGLGGLLLALFKFTKFSAIARMREHIVEWAGARKKMLMGGMVFLWILMVVAGGIGLAHNLKEE